MTEEQKEKAWELIQTALTLERYIAKTISLEGAAKEILEMAAEKFKNGEDGEAKLLREISSAFSDQAKAYRRVWRETKQAEQSESMALLEELFSKLEES